MLVGMIGANDIMMMMMMMMMIMMMMMMMMMMMTMTTTTMTRQLLGARRIGDLDNSIASTDAERRNVEMLTSQHEGSSPGPVIAGDYCLKNAT